MSEIKIGDKAIFIDDVGWSNTGGIRLSYRGSYTVLDISTCKKCGNITYDLGCKLSDIITHAKCPCGTSLAGLGIRWVKASRFLPQLTNFKNFTRKEIIEAMQDDITELVKNKEYEKAVEAIKRLEKIYDEL